MAWLIDRGWIDIFTIILYNLWEYISDGNMQITGMKAKYLTMRLVEFFEYP